MARGFNMPLRTSTTVISLFDCSWHSQQIAEYIIGGRHQDRDPRDGYQVFECPLMIFIIAHLGISLLTPAFLYLSVAGNVDSPTRERKAERRDWNGMISAKVERDGAIANGGKDDLFSAARLGRKATTVAPRS